MTDSSKTLIGLVVDRSGSMGFRPGGDARFWATLGMPVHELRPSVAEDMTRAIAKLLKDQAKINPKAKVTLAQFDTEYELVYPATTITKVPDYSIAPRAGTALLDAVGTFVTQVGEELARLPEHKRPATVMIAIVTDGMENSSREWTYARVSELIKHQTDRYNWDFVFLGANMDAPAVAADMGIARGKSMTYSVANSASTMDSLNTYMSNVAVASAGPAPAEAMRSVNFTEEDKANAVKETTSP